ncbi:PREDICTED: solute carrier family 25 member 51 isoform X1 [Thamnophis sirtalis]|uniref:Solute carrier family 25 member 51 isoform X1 n=1 Tax=Thamnophis sirtalis TaxID=35019 RepID=A0A6I9Y5C6_9SAUR|nr:PREDICTED: solute carrier family 25 member 51 isoform X1 [Thamnophis sirtalis]XP_013913021.1 PREDICTED: solute carrier family 25 member 51 isoform X1 [Thamnophis sirtalis]XP_013913022.1 PREDICTED: solute carrier family 25 member 51 isoform X1 [Thamnophis sirtalis]XP_013913024.1 PREDICTED: solute carrier family 25 member 51 isoform X1 [Thamnophis sirtalis]XP_013913025.1 PREDICTED: solute carrier family 25 member 51 isoform X1 [Thamnophis sirtalis]XP_013913026.1 PREDICTED: solute carrier fami
MADSEDILLNKAKADQTANRIVKVNSGKHYLCGYCAAITNIAITFPIQKVLFRQQLYGVRTRDAICQLQKDGIRNLYRGILPPLMQKSTTLALMFGLYEDLSSVLLRHISTPEIFARSLAAVLAGTTEAGLTPFERVQTLLQDYKHHDKFTNTYQAFRVLREHGAREYYRGLVPILLRNGPSNALFFGLRGPIKQCLPEATTYIEHRTILSCQFPGYNGKTLASIYDSITFKKLNCRQVVVSVVLIWIHLLFYGCQVACKAQVSKIGLSDLQMTQRSDIPNTLGTSIKIQENPSNFSFNKDKCKILHFCE